MALDKRLADQDTVPHLDMFEAHKVGAGCIYSDPSEAVCSELFVLLDEHINNFTARLAETYEKYSHLNDTIQWARTYISANIGIFFVL
jgi:hypothetical protein